MQHQGIKKRSKNSAEISFVKTGRNQFSTKIIMNCVISFVLKAYRISLTDLYFLEDIILPVTKKGKACGFNPTMKSE